MQRPGLTLIEVIVAIFLFSTAGLALAAGSAAVARQMSLTHLRSRGALIARTRDERSHAGGCSSAGSGTETSGAIVATWATLPGLATRLEQTIQRPATASVRIDKFLSAIPCD